MLVLSMLQCATRYVVSVPTYQNLVLTYHSAGPSCCHPFMAKGIHKTTRMFDVFVNAVRRSRAKYKSMGINHREPTT